MTVYFLSLSKDMHHIFIFIRYAVKGDKKSFNKA